MELGTGITGKSYDWVVPTPSNNLKKCLVRVIGYNGRVKVGENRTSSPFTIEVVRLISPNGGGVLLTPGETQTISWTTAVTKSPVASVKLYYSTNGGSSWRLIKTLENNTGSYNWRVPYVPNVRSKSKVKVLLRNENGSSVGSDTSDIAFMITPPE